MTEYLFRDEDLINEVIDTAINDNTFRSDDLEFTFAARVRLRLSIAVSFPLSAEKSLSGHPHFECSCVLFSICDDDGLANDMIGLQAWSDCVSFGNFDSYREKFEEIQQHFAPRIPDAVRLGNEMIKTILEKTGSGLGK